MWNGLLTSESYQGNAKTLFHNDILEDEEKLWEASRKGNAECVRAILSQKMVNLNTQVGSRWSCTPWWSCTPLNSAAMYGRTSVVKILLDRGADPNKTSVHGRTPLHWATQNGLEDVVQVLLDAGQIMIKQMIMEEHHLMLPIVMATKQLSEF